MKMMMKKKSSGSTKEPSRTSPFVLGPSGQNYDFSSGPLTVYRRYARRPPLDPIIVCTVAQNYSVFFLLETRRQTKANILIVGLGF